MRDFSVDLIWTKIQIAVSAIGGWLGYFLGGVDGLMIALIVFMVLDYLTGLMCAVLDKKLSSAIGFRGIFKKALILIVVGILFVLRRDRKNGKSSCGGNCGHCPMGGTCHKS